MHFRYASDSFVLWNSAAGKINTGIVLLIRLFSGKCEFEFGGGIEHAFMNMHIKSLRTFLLEPAI